MGSPRLNVGDLEISFKRRVVKRLRGKLWHAQVHEDAYENHIPDMSFATGGIEGWVEFKFWPTYPKYMLLVGARSSQLSAGQLDWLEKRGARGSGQCYVMVGYGERQMFVVKYNMVRVIDGKIFSEAVRTLLHGEEADVMRTWMDNVATFARLQVPAE